MFILRNILTLLKQEQVCSPVQSIFWPPFWSTFNRSNWTKIEILANLKRDRWFWKEIRVVQNRNYRHIYHVPRVVHQDSRFWSRGAFQNCPNVHFFKSVQCQSFSALMPDSRTRIYFWKLDFTHLEKLCDTLVLDNHDGLMFFYWSRIFKSWNMF